MNEPIIPVGSPEHDPDSERLAEIAEAIQQDPVIKQLRAATNAEFDAWWAANVTNFAQASNVLKRLTRLTLRRLP